MKFEITDSPNSYLKIDFENLKKINPKIITCTVSGFGESGPNFQRPAFDQIAQALGGGMSITGLSAKEPMRAGIPIGDLLKNELRDWVEDLLNKEKIEKSNLNYDKIYSINNCYYY